MCVHVCVCVRMCVCVYVVLECDFVMSQCHKAGHAYLVLRISRGFVIKIVNVFVRLFMLNFIVYV